MILAVGWREGSHITRTFVSLSSGFALICVKATALMLLAHHCDHQGAIVRADVAFQMDDLLPRPQYERAVAHRHRQRRPEQCRLQV